MLSISIPPNLSGKEHAGTEHTPPSLLFSVSTIKRCLYLPNGNPAPGSKFDYKLRWLERLTAHTSNFLKWHILTLNIKSKQASYI